MTRYDLNSLTDEKCYRLWSLMLQTSHLMSRSREKDLRPFGLRRMEAAILQVLILIDHAPTISELSRMIIREPHTVGSLVYRMERKGLLKIKNDSKRKNLKRLIVTEKSKDLAIKTIAIPSIRRIMTCLSDEDQTKFRQYLRTIRAKAIDDMGMSHRYPVSHQTR